MYDSFWFCMIRFDFIRFLLISEFRLKKLTNGTRERKQTKKHRCKRHYHLQISDRETPNCTSLSFNWKKLRSEKWELGHTFVRWRRVGSLIAQNRGRAGARARSTTAVSVTSLPRQNSLALFAQSRDLPFSPRCRLAATIGADVQKQKRQRRKKDWPRERDRERNRERTAENEERQRRKRREC